MRLIPVMDLRGGVAVHAIKGERKHYQPVASVLSDTADPLVVARAFREKLGLSELYIADLDAIQGHGDHRELIARLADQERMKLLVDAGAADVESALEILATGANKVIIGAETLTTWEALQAIRAAIPAGRLVFSLDMQAGLVLSRCPQLAASSPLQILDSLHRAGWQEVILLDLARVGTSAGVDRALIAETRRRFPELALLIGGGVRDVSELGDLNTMGVAGALVATALHRGTITRQHIAAFDRSDMLDPAKPLGDQGDSGGIPLASS
jgi:phosphoribosylformimino-5-aminoimidazole carboxamide ribotide isomerase